MPHPPTPPGGPEGPGHHAGAERAKPRGEMRIALCCGFPALLGEHVGHVGAERLQDGLALAGPGGNDGDRRGLGDAAVAVSARAAGWARAAALQTPGVEEPLL